MSSILTEEELLKEFEDCTTQTMVDYTIDQIEEILFFLREISTTFSNETINDKAYELIETLELAQDVLSNKEVA